ncbi:MAG: NAD(P)/FAD-dependent oxidoreductase [Bryobacteraceae bacterium]|nr:NAD(P)/FAD-dependent oxidoreductase [Bryobacteraceae bacterium]
MPLTHIGRIQSALIIGAGPAGLTAAYELLRRTAIVPVVVEKSSHIGGISRTVNYKGNRIDIGGHRFFSKSDRVMDWWLEILPLEAGAAVRESISYQGKTRAVEARETGPDPEKVDLVMLVRRRLSRIYYLRRFFSYPLQLSFETIRNLGLWRTVRIGASYARAALFPIRPERSLEDFLINRFGRELYRTFFQAYTEKVWGVPCSEISAEWGAQRIKGLSVTKALLHMLKSLHRSATGGIAQKETETSLIEKFLYPKLGPGQLWEEVARRVVSMGGDIRLNHEVVRLEWDGRSRIEAVVTRSAEGDTQQFPAGLVFSTMPVRDLVAALDPPAPETAREIATGLAYRDFLTVGLLCRRLKVEGPGPGERLRDNWIYIQEPEVLVGRLQIFNNWSPWMVADPSTVWIGLEYFCNEGDSLWSRSDGELIELAKKEMDQIGIVDPADVLDATVVRMEKAYPAYFGSYNRFPELRSFLDGIENLVLIGRNGMHRYNNQDHSMLAAMTAVDQIIEGRIDRNVLWGINTEQEYHEEKS